LFPSVSNATDRM